MVSPPHHPLIPSSKRRGICSQTHLLAKEGPGVVSPPPLDPLLEEEGNLRPDSPPSSGGGWGVVAGWRLPLGSVDWFLFIPDTHV